MVKKERRLILTARLPADVWRRLHEIRAELTRIEGKSVSANAALVWLIQNAKAPKLSAGASI